MLSHGDQKRLEIAISLASRPRLLMLDEPTAGMSRFESRETVALLKKISEEQGLTLVFTEHDMDIVFGISEKHHRAASRAGDSRRAARRKSRPTPKCARPIWAMNMSLPAGVEGSLLWPFWN